MVFTTYLKYVVNRNSTKMLTPLEKKYFEVQNLFYKRHISFIQTLNVLILKLQNSHWKCHWKHKILTYFWQPVRKQCLKNQVQQTVNFKEEGKQLNSLWKSLLYLLTKIKLVSILSSLLFPEYTSKIKKENVSHHIQSHYRFFKKKTYNGWIPFRGQHSNPLQYSCLDKNPHGQRRLAGYNPWGCRVRHDWMTKHRTAQQTPFNWKIHKESYS